MTKPKTNDPGLFGGEAPKVGEAVATATKSQPKKQAGPQTAEQAKKGELVPMRPPTREDVALVAAIANASTNPNTNVAVMKELREALREAREQLAKNAFSRDFLALERALPEIKKDGTIDMGETRGGRKGVKSSYVKFESLHKAVMPLVNEHNFTLSFENGLRGGALPGDEGGSGVQEIVIGILEHVADPGGQHDTYARKTERLLTPDASGAKNAQQAKAAGASYLKRYMTMDLLNIRSLMPEHADLDGNEPAEKPQTIDGSQAKAALKKVNDCGVSSDALAKKFKALGIERIQDMPAAEFEPFMQACERYRDDAAKRATK